MIVGALVHPHVVPSKLTQGDLAYWAELDAWYYVTYVNANSFCQLVPVHDLKRTTYTLAFHLRFP